jgi:glutathione-regulated potassium-efflux system ancillary protein KefG
MKKILMVFAHPFPRKSRANRLILEKVRGLPNLTVSDLYEKYPYFHIDVNAEKKLLLAHDIIFFQHPFYWYSGPPLLKLWFDEVLELGWAYGPGGQALKGKQFLVSLTTGGPFESYSSVECKTFTIEQMLPPYIQTAGLCQMKWLEPLILRGVHQVSAEDLEIYVQSVKSRLSEISKGDSGL